MLRCQEVKNTIDDEDDAIMGEDVWEDSKTVN
jgi:hypothetical protein